MVALAVMDYLILGKLVLLNFTAAAEAAVRLILVTLAAPQEAAVVVGGLVQGVLMRQERLTPAAVAEEANITPVPVALEVQVL